MSDNYRALTRTYRPRTFDDIVSQSHVSSTLKNAIKQNRLAHAYMFCGPRGVGKTTMARVLARTVNDIEQEVDGESLNQTLNVIEIDAASNNGVDDIRDLRERVRIPPQNGRYKIYIIDEVHMLSKAAFNALLKTLEEPPDHVIFIFATTEPHKVLPTILSRVQRFDFKRISIDEIVERLRIVARDEDISIDDESLHVLAKKADGALRDALGLLDQSIAFCGTDIEHEELLRALNVVSTDRMFQFMDTVEQHDATRGLQLINELLEEGYDIQEFLVGLTEHLRNLYVARSSESMHLVEASERMKQRYREDAGAFAEDDLMRMLHIVSEAQFKVKEAHQPKIQFEITLLKLIHMERSQKLNTLISGLEQLKKNGGIQQAVNKAAPEAPETGKTACNDDSEPDSPTSESDDPDPAEEPPEAEDTAPAAASTSRAEEPPANHEAVSRRNGTSQPHDEDKDDREGEEQDAEIDEDKETGPGDGSPAPEEPINNNPASEPDTEDGDENENDASRQVPAGSQPEQPAAKSSGPSISALLNRTSLGNGSDNGNGSAAVTEKPQTRAEEAAAEAGNRANPGSKVHNITLAAVKEHWNDYVTALKEHVQQMLYFQMQRVEPIKLKNRELVLRCNDDFAKQMVEEHKRELGKILEGQVGGFLRFSCVVQKDETDVESTMSPYERFKKLQERDPQIKTLVELFGAELDYNLNQ